MTAGRVHDALKAAGVPIVGVSIGRDDDKATWRIAFDPAVTDAQRATAAAIVAAIDLSTPMVPHEISRFQATEALRRAGRLTEIETALALIGDASEDHLKTAKIAWETAQVFRRQSPTLAAFAALLGMTSGQVDALFIAGAQIEA